MKKIIGLIVLMILIIGVLSGCTGNSVENNTGIMENKTEKRSVSTDSKEDTEIVKWPRTIKDAAGNDVILEKKPERIAVLHAVYLDYFFALETPPIASAGATIGDAMKALEEFETLRSYKGTANIIDLGSARDLNLEAILESRPDVIVTFKGHIDKVYEELIKIAPVIQLDVKDTWQNTTVQCASIVGKEELASKYIEETEKIISETRKKLSTFKDETFALLRVDGKGNFVATGYGNSIYYNQMEGFNLLAPDTYPGSQEVLSLEALSQMNPDYIIFQHFLDVAQAAVESQESSTVWKSLNAVKNNHILFFDDSLNTGSPLAIRLASEKFIKILSD
ncbi:ABC transporter substrate-binding protein [Tissierella praeacuta]|uniref:ABC transporter substrate-binding protein n=1 Tax=Tissierella praeacuta TaxID=43131 RepID=UPI00333E35D4